MRLAWAWAACCVGKTRVESLTHLAAAGALGEEVRGYTAIHAALHIGAAGRRRVKATVLCIS